MHRADPDEVIVVRGPSWQKISHTNQIQIQRYVNRSNSMNALSGRHSPLLDHAP